MIKIDAIPAIREAPRVDPSVREHLVAQIRHQSTACTTIGSPIHGDLLGRIADDVEADGLCAQVLRDHAELRFGLALPLRFVGALHRRALDGRAPTLATFLPSCVGEGASSDPAARWQAAYAVIARDSDAIRSELDAHVQTNEIGRSSALILGLAHVARVTGHPLALREIGTSAGLNLRLDRYAYSDNGGPVHGDPESGVRIVDRWRGVHRPLQDPSWSAPVVVDRAGADPSPIDPLTAEGRIRLLGFVWPEQLERKARTEAAIDLARKFPARVEAAHTPSWLAHELEQRRVSTTMTVMHSIVWQYIDKEERPSIRTVIEEQGARAGAERPVAWLTFEPDPTDLSRVALCCRVWRGADDDGQVVGLARSGFHGEWVEAEASPVQRSADQWLVG